MSADGLGQIKAITTKWQQFAAHLGHSKVRPLNSWHASVSRVWAGFLCHWLGACVLVNLAGARESGQSDWQVSIVQTVGDGFQPQHHTG